MRNIIRGGGKQKLPLIVFFLVAGLSLYVFYTVVHPMYIFDLDDWYYISYGRHAFPTFSMWKNPTKVMPETLMPLVSYIGVFFIYPLTGDYIQSLLYIHAFTTVFFILVYLFFAGKILAKRFSLDSATLTLFLTVYLLSHFTPFFVKDIGCYHLFNSMNVNCFFNYTIPALWNFTMCFYFMTTESSKKMWYEKEDGWKKSFLVLGVYLAINSNLWTSQILMIYFGVRLLLILIENAAEEKKNGQKWFTVSFLKRYIMDNFPKLAAIGCWLFSMTFELHAPTKCGVTSSFMLKESFSALLRAIGSMNKAFLFFVVAINMLALLVVLVRRRKTHGRDGKFLYWQLEIAICMVLCMVYQVLMGAVLKDGPGYVVRNDTLMTWMLWLLMMTAGSLVYLYRCQPRLQWFGPLLVFILLIEVVVSYPTYVGNYATAETPSQVKAINDDIISQIVLADQAGEDMVEVHIPVSISTGWPLDLKDTPAKVGWTLFCHGITERSLDITFLPDPEKDLQFHLNG